MCQQHIYLKISNFFSNVNKALSFSLAPFLLKINLIAIVSSNLFCVVKSRMRTILVGNVLINVKKIYSHFFLNKISANLNTTGFRWQTNFATSHVIFVKNFNKRFSMVFLINFKNS